MSEYLLPPYKAFIKTSTGKIVRTKNITDTELNKGKLYVIWQECYYGTIATFKELVVATADTMEELAHDTLPKKRFSRY